jgi:hypothetical protein
MAFNIDDTKTKIVDKKIPIVIAVALVTTILVYLALENSLLFPTFFSTPISNEEAISIVVHKLNIMKYNVNDFSTRYVYLKGDGSVFESNINSNSIGKYIGKTEPTITTGSYFAWEVKNNNYDYFLDSTTGEIVSSSNSRNSAS